MNKLIKLGADWCGPCKIMDGILKDIDLKEFNTTLEPVNIDTNKELAVKYNVRSIPFFALEDSEGNLLRTAIGAMTLKETRDFLVGT